MIEFDLTSVSSMEDELEKGIKIPDSLKSNVYIGHVALGGLYLMFSNRGKGFDYVKDASHKFTIHFYSTAQHRIGMFVSCKIGMPAFVKEHISYTYDEVIAIINKWFEDNEQELLSYIKE